MADHIVIGGHGKVALLTMPLLREAGHSVTGVIRNPEHEHDIEAAGGKPLVLDMETALEDDLVRAFEGKDAVVWSAGAGGGNPGRTYAVDRDAAIRSMGAALRAGVRRYVMVSYFGAGPDHGIPQDDPFHAYAQAKAAADAHLRSSGLDWTILGPATLTLVQIGTAIAIALAVQVISATIIGAALPLASAAVKIDPALIASPALTTIVDITGLLIYFGITKTMLGI